MRIFEHEMKSYSTPRGKNKGILVVSKLPRASGFRAKTKLSKLAGQLAKYTKANNKGDLVAKRQARMAIAGMIGI